MKKTIWVIGPIIAIVLGFFIGRILYKEEEKIENDVPKNVIPNIQINNVVSENTITELMNSIIDDYDEMKTYLNREGFSCKEVFYEK